jgi:hypothetical protein
LLGAQGQPDFLPCAFDISLFEHKMAGVVERNGNIQPIADTPFAVGILLDVTLYARAFINRCELCTSLTIAVGNQPEWCVVT